MASCSAAWRIDASSASLMSSSVRPANLAGRSSGVAYSFELVNVPCRSGSPHGVRDGVHVFALDYDADFARAGVDCASASDANATTRTAAMRIPRIRELCS
jgi:hypothetical protein